MWTQKAKQEQKHSFVSPTLPHTKITHHDSVTSFQFLQSCPLPQFPAVNQLWDPRLRLRVGGLCLFLFKSFFKHRHRTIYGDYQRFYFLTKFLQGSGQTRVTLSLHHRQFKVICVLGRFIPCILKTNWDSESSLVYHPHFKRPISLYKASRKPGQFIYHRDGSICHITSQLGGPF